MIALKEAECCAPGGHGLRPTPLRRRAGRPQPKSDPLGSARLASRKPSHALTARVVGRKVSFLSVGECFMKRTGILAVAVGLMATPALAQVRFSATPILQGGATVGGASIAYPKTD